MGKAKLGHEEKQKVVVVNYDNYIRFGYRLPGGLVVTRKEQEIPQKDLDRLNLKCSIIDMAPVYDSESIDFDTIVAILGFSEGELAKREFDKNEALAVTEPEREDVKDIWALTGTPTADETCNCDQCEGHNYDQDPNWDSSTGTYKSDPGDDNV